MSVSIKWDESAFRELNENGVVGAAVAKAAQRIRNQAVLIISKEGRVNTGKLRQSIHAQKISATATEVVWEIASRLPYSGYQHEGVQGPIYPRRAKALRFKPKGSGVYIFAKSVKGFEGIYYLKKPLEALTVRDFM